MKKLTSFFLSALLSLSSLFASDDAFVANWQLPIDFWFAGAGAPAEGIDAYPRSTAFATALTAFDATTANFDATWALEAGNGYAIGGAAGNRLGLAASDKGAADFTGAFKVFYDDANLYILVQFTDDDVTGNETLEVPIAPYFKLDAANRTDFPTAYYTRWSQFGANKLLFAGNGFQNAMTVNFSAAGVGTIDWAGKPAILNDNLFVDDKTAPASKTLKWIITIGYPVLTGSQRPVFNTSVWAALPKGISFDLKINDVDTDDALNGDATPKKAPAEYWWNATNNDCWMSTIYAGFVKQRTTAVDNFYMTNFANITANKIELSAPADVVVYNAVGKQVINRKNASVVNISNLKKGVYVLRANNQSQKFVK